jgi:hypothetical protein
MSSLKSSKIGLAAMLESLLFGVATISSLVDQDGVVMGNVVVCVSLTSSFSSGFGNGDLHIIRRRIAQIPLGYSDLPVITELR